MSSEAIEPAADGSLWSSFWRSRTAAIGIFCAALGTAGLGLCLYVARSHADALLLDGLQLLSVVDDYFSGRLTLAKLFSFYGEHRLPMYRLLMIANSAWFGLNMFVDPIISIVLTLATAALLYGPFRRSLAARIGPAGASAAFVPMVAICASLTSVPVMLMSTQFQVATVLMVVIGRYLLESPSQAAPIRRLIVAACLALVYSTLFAGGYFGGLLAAMLAVFAFRSVLERKYPDKAEWAALAVTLVWTVGTARDVSASGVLGQSLPSKLTPLFLDPRTTGEYLLGGLAAAVVDIHSCVDPHGPEAGEKLGLFLGLAMAVFVAVALWLFVRSRMWRVTYLPVWLLAYSIGIICLVRVGRPHPGLLWMMNEWYAFHLKFIPLAVFWIVFFAAANAQPAANPASRPGWKFRLGLIPVVSFAAFLAATWLYANEHQWARGKHLKAWLEAARLAALAPPDTTEPFENALYVSRGEANAALAIMSKYRLNVFRDATRATLQRRDPSLHLRADFIQTFTLAGVEPKTHAESPTGQGATMGDFAGSDEWPGSDHALALISGYHYRAPPMQVEKGDALEFAIRIPYDRSDGAGLRIRAVRAGESSLIFDDAKLAPSRRWVHHTIDLSRFAGSTIELDLEAYSPTRDTTADWIAFKELAVFKRSSADGTHAGR